MRRFALVVMLALSACRGGTEPAAVVQPPLVVKDAVPEYYESEKGRYAVTALVAGLVHPWGLAFLPDGAMLVTERPGRLRRITQTGEISEPIGGLPTIFVDGQAGLLDVAVSPTYATDQLVYMSFAEPTLRGNKAGTAVLLISTDLDELVELADSIAVVSNGSIVGRLENDGRARDRIGELMVGGSAS